MITDDDLPMRGRIVEYTRVPELKDARGKLVVERNAATFQIRVTVFNEYDRELIRFVAVAVEIELVEAPFDAIPKKWQHQVARSASGKLATLPGSLWFYGAQLEDSLGFIPDHMAGAYELPMAIAQPRSGHPMKPRKA